MSVDTFKSLNSSSIFNLFSANTYSDRANGELIFFTDGNACYDNSLQKTPNGDSIFYQQGISFPILILGGSRNSLIVENPKNSSQFFAFAELLVGFSSSNYSELRYALFDRRLNGSKGDIVKNEKGILLSDSSQGICVLRDTNGIDSWLVTHDLTGNGYKFFHISDTGISNPNIVFGGYSISGLSASPLGLSGSWIRELKSSPNSQMIATLIRNEDDSLMKLELYNVNNGSGTIVSLIDSTSIKDFGLRPSVYSVCFSPNSQYLYLFGQTIYQYDLSVSNPFSTSLDSFNFNGIQANYDVLEGQIGLDGKIYLSSIHDSLSNVDSLKSKFLHVINCPDESAALTSIQLNSVDLKGKDGDLTFPTLNQSWYENTSELRIIPSKDFLCGQDTMRLTALGGSTDIIKWFPSIAISDTLSTSPLVYPDSSITYSLVYQKSCSGIIDTMSFLVEVKPLPITNLSDSILCSSPSEILLGDTNFTNQLYLWDSLIGLVNLDSPFARLNVRNFSGRADTLFATRRVDLNGCMLKDSSRLILLPEPRSPSIFGNFLLCPGSDSILYYDLNDSSSNNTWGLSGGQAIQNFDDSLLVSWGSISGHYHITAFANNSFNCPSETDTLFVELSKVLKPEIVFDKDSICDSDRESQQYYSRFNTRSSQFIWSVENGHIVSGQFSDSILVNWDSLGPYSIVLSQSDTTSTDTCFGASDTLSLIVLPNPRHAIISDSLYCVNDTIQLRIDGFDNSSFEWIVNGNQEATTEDSLIISSDSSLIYDLIVIETSNFGCRGDSAYKTIFVDGLPNPAIVNPDTFFCLSNADSLAFSVSGDVGSQYLWEVYGGLFLTGNDEETIAVALNTELDSFGIQVWETNLNGCKDVSDFLSLDFQPGEADILNVSYDSSDETLIRVDYSELGLTNASLQIRNLSDSEYDTWTDLSTPLDSWGSLLTRDFGKGAANQIRLVGSDGCGSEVVSNVRSTIFLDYAEVPAGVSLFWNKPEENSEIPYKLTQTADGELVEYFFQMNETTIPPHLLGFTNCFRVSQNSPKTFSNTVCLDQQFEIDAPNAITPNGDGYNDYLVIQNAERFTNTLSIYNRWGQEVFQVNAYANDWPQGPAEAGVYYFEIVITDPSTKELKSYKGSFTVFD